MRALIATGEPGELVTFADVAAPEPAAGEAVIEVEAFSVNRGEILRLHRPRPGWRPGKDIAGLVVQEAADGTGPRVGERVVAHPPGGGWARSAAVPTGDIAVLPDTLSFVLAAALPLAGLTALRLVRVAGEVRGRRVLVTGASGGVGHFVVELLASGGAEVTAVTASAERGERLAALGAHAVVRDLDECAGPFDVVLESVGGSSTSRALAKLGRGGLLVWFGGVSREPVTLNFFDFFAGPESGSIRHFSYPDFAGGYGPDLRTLVDLTAAGRLHPEIGLSDDWSQTAKAINAVVERSVRGKAVLTVGD